MRVADNGLSIVADPYGRILASTDHFTVGDRVIVRGNRTVVFAS